MRKILQMMGAIGLGFVSSFSHNNQNGFSQKKVIGYCFMLLILMLHMWLWYYQLRAGNFGNFA